MASSPRLATSRPLGPRHSLLDAPPPVGRSSRGPALISPDSVLAITRKDLPKVAEDGVRHRDPWSKALFFLLREGLMTTGRKIDAVRAEQRLVARQRIVVAKLRWQKTTFLGVTRDIGGPLRFDRALLFEPAFTGATMDPDSIVLSPAAIRSLASYLPVPSCPLPRELPGLIVSANPGLRAVSRSMTALDEERPGRESSRRARLGSAMFSDAPRGGDRREDAVFLLGNGAYVRQTVAPHFKDRIEAALDYRADLMNEHLRSSYPITSSFDDVLDRIARVARPQVVISTYHSDHARMALEVLRTNPEARIFVQKPAAVELDDIEALVAARRSGAWIDVGFNRRHAPMTSWLKRQLERRAEPVTMNMIVKEVKIPSSHWYFWSNQGTRITGNLSHWIDLSYHLIGAPPETMCLLGSGDDVSLAIRYADGSLVNIVATDKGDDLRGVEERIEVRTVHETLVVDDYCNVRCRSGRSRRKSVRLRRDKGQSAMFERFARQAPQPASKPAYPVDALFWTGYMTFHAARMLVNGESSHEVDPLAPVGTSELLH